MVTRKEKVRKEKYGEITSLYTHTKNENVNKMWTTKEEMCHLGQMRLM